MGRYQDTVWCDGCGLEILWIPLQIGSAHYCCRDCQEGMRCECREDLEQDDRAQLPVDLAQIPGATNS